MTMPTLVIGHHADPLHPFSDSGMLAEELPNSRLIEANSIFEWRISPERLDDELAGLPRRRLGRAAAARAGGGRLRRLSRG